MENPSRIQALYTQFMLGQITEPEMLELFSLADDPENEAVFLTLMDGSWEDLEAAERRLQAARKEPAVQGSIRLPDSSEKRVRRLSWRHFAAAAVVIVLLGVGAWWIASNYAHRSQAPIAQQKPADVLAPASNRASLTLGGGRVIYLDSVGNGMLTTEGSVTVRKNADGQVSYSGENRLQDELVYNTLFNPRGSKVLSLTLADGSRVWLNAESSLKYPVTFNGRDREVEVTGEAYFEIAPDPARPFLVKKENTEIEVLGTNFNVNAYPEKNSITVTLLEGSVRVKRDERRLMLKSGEQAVVSNTIQLNKDVDLDRVMAWKNGIFDFEQERIEPIMSELGRWYDVQVSYSKDVPATLFTAIIRRDNNASQVLKLMERTQRIHFKIEGKKITVMK